MVMWGRHRRVTRAFYNEQVKMGYKTGQDVSELQRQLIVGWHSLIVRIASADFPQKFIASKTKAALDGGLGVILCVGETLEVSLPQIPSPISFSSSSLY